MTKAAICSVVCASSFPNMSRQLLEQAAEYSGHDFFEIILAESLPVYQHLLACQLTAIRRSTRSSTHSRHANKRRVTFRTFK